MKRRGTWIRSFVLSTYSDIVPSGQCSGREINCKLNGCQNSPKCSNIYLPEF